MGIWERLGIEKTRDKKRIRKAYAERAKVCHPEERPEEFRQLYEAYQAALVYADREIDDERTDEAEAGPSEPSGPSAAAEPVMDLEMKLEFDRIEQERAERRAYCLNTWEELLDEHAGNRDKWKEFLESESFRQMKTDPLVLERICDGLEVHEEILDLYLQKLWVLYGFTKEEEPTYQGDMNRLYRRLYPAWERKQVALSLSDMVHQMAKEEERKKRNGKAIVCFCICCVVSLLLAVYGYRFIRNHIQEKSVRAEAERYLEARYPEERFTYLNSRWDGGGNEIQILTFRPEETPDMTVTVRFTEAEDGVFGQRILTEDYGFQLLMRYAAEAGLKYDHGWRGEIFYYNGLEDIENFCAQISRFAREERVVKLQSILTEVHFCPSEILFPDIMLYGGDGGLPVKTSYSFDRIPAAEQLKKELTKQYIDYLYNYEAWNITPEIEAQYGEAYRARISTGQGQAKGGSAIAVFEKVERIKAPAGSGEEFEEKIIEYMTVGNLYQYLTANGVPVAVNPDRGGFSVSAGGRVFLYGTGQQKLYVPLSHARSLVEEALKK